MSADKPLTSEITLDSRKETSLTKEILILTVPVSIIFALSGMDFIGFYTSTDPVYTRSLGNVLYGFLFTTLGLLVLPLLVNHFRWKRPLSEFGLTAGKKKLGLLIVLAYIPAVIVFYFNSKDPSMINTYPLTKDVLSSWSFFLFYELLYVLFYYIPYEFFFRGVLQLGLSRKWNKWHSIIFVTVLSTALHATKPLPEIGGAIIAGFLLGYVAEKTQSWYYAFLMHIITGLSTDLFCSLYYTGVWS